MYIQIIYVILGLLYVCICIFAYLYIYTCMHTCTEIIIPLCKS